MINRVAEEHEYIGKASLWKSSLMGCLQTRVELMSNTTVHAFHLSACLRALQ